MEWYRKADENKPVEAPKASVDEFMARQLRKEAEAGNAQAQFNLGVMYGIGKGVPKDAAKKVEWYQKAAAQGHADAQYRLGVAYRDGNGVPKDTAKAVEWYQKAAAQGNAYAQFNLGAMYFAGEGVPKDAAKAAEWYQKAAAQGDADAQFKLGAMYGIGDGVPKDAAKAAEWWQKAAAQGNAAAQFFLGKLYIRGEGVPKDDTKAVEWWQKAAAQGHAEAQLVLGLSYAIGEGVSRDLVRAYAWHNLAAAQGHEDAKKFRDSVETQLTPAQRAEGQRLASNWKKGELLQVAGDTNPNSSAASGTPTKRGTGTGFIVSFSGHALTNHHVIDGCKEIRVAGQDGAIKVVTSDVVNDLALLQMPEKANAATLTADTAKLRQGEDVTVYGYPLNAVLSSGGNLTPGTVSALTGLGNNTNQIQITAPIQPGSSGSPVMDKKGNVVGVVSMKLSDTKMVKATGSVGQNVNFAVNGQTVKAFLDANKVAYKTGGGFFSREKSNADIAEEARKWTVVLECWK